MDALDGEERPLGGKTGLPMDSGVRLAGITVSHSYGICFPEDQYVLLSALRYLQPAFIRTSHCRCNKLEGARDPDKAGSRSSARCSSRVILRGLKRRMEPGMEMFSFQ